MFPIDFSIMCLRWNSDFCTKKWPQTRHQLKSTSQAWLQTLTNRFTTQLKCCMNEFLAPILTLWLNQTQFFHFCCLDQKTIFDKGALPSKLSSQDVIQTQRLRRIHRRCLSNSTKLLNEREQKARLQNSQGQDYKAGSTRYDWPIIRDVRNIKSRNTHPSENNTKMHLSNQQERWDEFSTCEFANHRSSDAPPLTLTWKIQPHSHK